MKKVIFTLMLSGLIIIGLVSTNSVFAGITNTEVPDIEKKVKKESSKTSKKAAITKTSNTNQKDSDPSNNNVLQSTSNDNFDQNNPALNDDCTKEGFDKE